MGNSVNFTGNIIIFTAGAANAENTLLHGMRSTPRGFISIGQTAAGRLYLSTTTWTSTSAYLKSSIAGVTYSVLFFA
jgi:hypothetical protein